jgi:outer membrane protein OmpA-like peptidoglycan-associated protein
MKKSLIPVIFVFLTLALLVSAEESKKIMNIQRAYVYLDEALLISDTDLNCSYFIRDDMPQDIRIVAKHLSSPERTDFSDFDDLVINKGSKDGLKDGDLLMIMSEGPVIRHSRSHDRLGRYFLKKSLAQITCVYDKTAVITLQKGCNPVNIGDFAILYKPEETLFARPIDYKLCRIPANAVNGMVVYTDLGLGYPSEIVSDNQYVSVDLGEGVVGKGTFLLFYRQLASDLPPLIVGMGVVLHSEKTNSTVKVLDASSDIRLNDRTLVLPRLKEQAAAGGQENIPVVETLAAEGQAPEAGAAGQAAETAGNVLNFDVLFDFDSKQPIADHAADFTAIKDFVAGKSEYLITLRGYTCSIGREEYNLRLSSERVETIKAILVKQYGIDPARIESFFYGEKDPQFDNSSEAERRKNRLVKIEVNGK